MNKTLTNFLSKDSVLIFYKYVMPVITVISLILISQIITRPRLLGSWFLDLVVRIFLCVWFCIGYVRLPNISEKYKFYPNITPKKSDIGPSGKVFYISLAIFFGILVALMTGWVLRSFLPFLSIYIIPIAILNGLIFLIPLIAQYEVFKV
jgi:hypothetical protein